ncbi:MAG: ribosome small subunit-dependent GTPase A [Thermoguttaceae bacterium]
MGSQKRKIRAEFRKNRTPRTRRTDWTGQLCQDGFQGEDLPATERIGKGELARRRTVIGRQLEQPDQAPFPVLLEVDEAACQYGQVLSVFGLTSIVEAEDGTIFRCVTRRLLKTLETDQRHVVVAGDRVLFRPVAGSTGREGIIERIEPRRGCLSRAVGGREQLLVANVDQALIVASAAQPRLKRHLIDRLVISAEKGRVRPVICINKVDLVDPATLIPLVGLYSQMGYQVLLLSALSGFGLQRLRRLLTGKRSVVAGQSGVGKSSLLNALDPTLKLEVAPVSADNEKGRHTTATARLLRLAFGAYVVDTPGIRQFQLWDVIAEEVAGFFRDFRPYVSRCKFPNCTHTHEADCAIKNAVADGWLDQRRYESYCHLVSGVGD